MAGLITNNAEGGSASTAVTLGNSGGASGTAFAVVSAGTSNTITYETTAAAHGSLGYLFTKGGTAASLLELRDLVAGDTLLSSRCYFTMTGLPSNDATQLGMQLRSTADVTMGRCQVSTTGTLKFFNAAAQISAGTYVLATDGSVYRMEMQLSGLNSGAGIVNCQVFLGDSTTPLDTISATGVSFTGLCDRVRFGNMASGTQATFTMDDLAINIGTNTAIGAAAVPDTSWTYDTSIVIG